MSLEREVLSKMVNDPTFQKKTGQEVLDMDSRTGFHNRMLNVAVEVLREQGWNCE